MQFDLNKYFQSVGLDVNQPDAEILKRIEAMFNDPDIAKGLYAEMDDHNVGEPHSPMYYGDLVLWLEDEKENIFFECRFTAASFEVHPASLSNLYNWYTEEGRFESNLITEENRDWVESNQYDITRGFAEFLKENWKKISSQASFFNNRRNTQIKPW